MTTPILINEPATGRPKPSGKARSRPPSVLYERYARVAPLSHALFRAAELSELAEELLEPPILDLGCGAGEFARVALATQVDCGLDLDARQLARAGRTGKYLRLCKGDAREMPLGSDSFGSVVSISVLEHIAEAERVIPEVYRVLKGGGIFLGTVVLCDLHRYLFYPDVLARLGLPRLAKLYVRLHDSVFRHRTLHSEHVWRALWTNAGFEVITCRKVVPRRVTRLWDLLLPFAFPFWLGRMIGCPIMLHHHWVTLFLKKALHKALVPEHGTDDAVEGSCLFFVLRKPVKEALWS